MKGLPGWLFAANSALPLRLRTAVREQQAWGSLALLSSCSAGLLESPQKSCRGNAYERSPCILLSVLLAAVRH